MSPNKNIQPSALQPEQVVQDEHARSTRLRTLLGRIGIGSNVPFPEGSAANIDNTEIASNIAERHFAAEAPSLFEVAADEITRDSTFRYTQNERYLYSGNPVAQDLEIGESIEGDAVAGLMDWLTEAASAIDSFTIDDVEAAKVTEQMLIETASPDSKSRLLQGISGMDRPEGSAQEIKRWLKRKVEALAQTSYVGEHEVKEAAHGLAAYWKAYLDEDPENQIAIPGIDEKSSGFVLEKILENYSEDELDSMRGRIINKIKDKTAPDKKLKVVMLDDWLMSGDQVYVRMMHENSGFFDTSREPQTDFTEDDFDAIDGEAEPVAEQAPSKTTFLYDVEINTLMADQRRITDGYNYGSALVGVPVHAYYRAPEALDAIDGRDLDRYTSRISGLHSSVDHNFGQTMTNVALLTEMLHQASGSDYKLPKLPALANVIRDYKDYKHPSTTMLFERKDVPVALASKVSIWSDFDIKQ